MDSLTLKSISASLDKLVSGKRVRGIIATEKGVLAITFIDSPGGIVLRLASPVAVYFEKRNIAPAKGLPPIADAEKLEGYVISEISQFADDRILCIKLEKGTEAVELVVELFRRPPSLYLVYDDGDTDVLFGKRVTEYAFPEDSTQTKTEFGNVGLDSIQSVFAEDDPVLALRNSITHLSPKVAKYLVTLDSDEAYEVMKANAEAIVAGGGVAQLVSGSWLAYPAPIYKNAETRGFSSINEAVKFAAIETTTNQLFTSRKLNILRELNKKRKKLEKQLAHLRKDLEKYTNPERYRELGDLLKTNFHKLKRGQSSIEVDDYYNNTTITIELNSADTPEKNMKRYYKMYQKAVSGIKEVGTRIGLIEGKLEGINKSIIAIESITSLDELPDTGGDKKSNKRKIEKNVIVGRRYLSSEGFEIVVGRSAKENDLVTFGVGKPSDLWLHVREAHGSHVIVRRKEKDKPFPKRTVNEAAAIAGFFSKSRNAEIVPVIVTERKYVSKIKGTPGLVKVIREEVIFVEPKEVLKPVSSE